MAQPVVHFEIIGNDPQKLRDYYTGLFGWEFQTPSPVAHEVSEPGSYGFLDVVTSEDGTGIRGGVGGGPSHKSHAVFYVGVPNVEAALQRAESLGGTRAMGPATSPNGLVVGHFTDPEGTLIGVAGVT
jgi:predicted enzyme related to lactoylglutathione lyase